MTTQLDMATIALTLGGAVLLFFVLNTRLIRNWAWGTLAERRTRFAVQRSVRPVCLASGRILFGPEESTETDLGVDAAQRHRELTRDYLEALGSQPLLAH